MKGKVREWSDSVLVLFRFIRVVDMKDSSAKFSCVSPNDDLRLFAFLGISFVIEMSDTKLILPTDLSGDDPL
jgi:hypothetical protein